MGAKRELAILDMYTLYKIVFKSSPSFETVVVQSLLVSFFDIVWKLVIKISYFYTHKRWVSKDILVFNTMKVYISCKDLHTIAKNRPYINIGPNNDLGMQEHSPP